MLGQNNINQVRRCTEVELNGGSRTTIWDSYLLCFVICLPRRNKTRKGSVEEEGVG